MPTQDEILQIRALVSGPRFEACRYNAESDVNTLARCHWNMALSEALHCSLSALEIAFRNRMYDVIAAHSKDNDWLLYPKFLNPEEVTKIDEAKRELTLRNKLTNDHLIAGLSFGFWTSLADLRYEPIWRATIKKILPSMPNNIRTRAEASRRLNAIRKLRNAVSHHLLIWSWKDLRDQHARTYEFLGWIDTQYANEAKRHDRFSACYAAGPAAFL